MYFIMQNSRSLKEAFDLFTKGILRKIMHKSNWCFKLELEWAVLSYKLPWKKQESYSKKKKSCTKSEKLLEGLKVASDLKSCLSNL